MDLSTGRGVAGWLLLGCVPCAAFAPPTTCDRLAFENAAHFEAHVSDGGAG